MRAESVTLKRGVRIDVPKGTMVTSVDAELDGRDRYEVAAEALAAARAAHFAAHPTAEVDSTVETVAHATASISVELRSDPVGEQ